jgi:hypothetical protein
MSKPSFVIRGEEKGTRPPVSSRKRFCRAVEHITRADFRLTNKTEHVTPSLIVRGCGPHKSMIAARRAVFHCQGVYCPRA